MYAYTKMLVSFILVIALFWNSSASGQGNSEVEQDEFKQFLEYYLSAFQKGNIQEMESLVQENKTYADNAAELFYIEGSTAYQTADYNNALSNLKISLKLSQQLDALIGQGLVSNVMGMTYQALGKYQEALKSYQVAVRIFEESGERLAQARTLSNIGVVYQGLNEHLHAMPYFHSAARIYIEADQIEGVGTVLNHIGQSYLHIQEYQEALDSFQNALKIFQESEAVDAEIVEAKVLSNIGYTYQQMGDHTNALRCFSDSRDISIELGDILGVAITSNNIAASHQALGEYQKALDLYKDALKTFQKTGSLFEEFSAHGNMGELYVNLNRFEDAAISYKHAIDILEGLGSPLDNIELKGRFREQYINLYPKLIDLLFLLQTPDEAFYYAERSKARAFLDLLREADEKIHYNIDAELLEKRNHIYAELSKVQSDLKMRPDKEELTKIILRHEEWQKQLDRINAEIKERYPAYTVLHDPQVCLNVSQVQRNVLQDGEVLIEYLQGFDKLYIFILSKTDFAAQVLSINSKELLNKVAEFRNSLLEANPAMAWDNTAAYQLYQVIFQPIEQEIRGISQKNEVNRLIIVPDNSLFYLPFEALVSRQNGALEFLIDRYAISYASSASVLKSVMDDKHAPEAYTRDLLALAPFSEPGKNQLPFSADEVQMISAPYAERADYKHGSEATKEYFLSHANNSRYLHLATHGYLDSESAMFCALDFNGEKLQTYEIFNLDINAELTTLSACETGLGELQAGEGIVGLTRAFMYAGSPSVLVSLWKVSDPSTTEFMKRFHFYLKGMNKVEALQSTKIWMKEGLSTQKSGEQEKKLSSHAHPFYWAPFILTGSYN